MPNEKSNNDKILKEIKGASEYLDLSEFVIEKDLYVTQAISIVSEISHDLYDLVFQGGTSLAKAHRIIERMSEDCDFRIRFKESENRLSKEFKRKALRKFRHDLVDALKAKGFLIEENAVRVRNEGQFMGIRANYPSIFPHVESMKPYIALEFFLAEVKATPVIQPVTTLIRQVFGDKVTHPEFPVNSVAIIETAAEKWVGLTRRVATSRHRSHYRDANLVRHLYDLYKINELGHFTAEFNALVPRIVLDDRKQYKNHNDDYYRDPVGEIKRAVDELAQSNEWHDNWHKFVDTMVFAKQKPSYQDVLRNLHEKTNLVLGELAKVDFVCDSPKQAEVRSATGKPVLSLTPFDKED